MAQRFLTAFLWSQRRIILWLAAILIVVVAVVFLKRADVYEYLSNYENRDRLRDEVDRLRAETKRLEQERDDLAKEGFAAEKAARERFRLSKKDEIVVYLETPTPRDGVTSPTLRGERR